MRRVIQLFISLAVLALLGGCLGDDNNNSTPPASTNNTLTYNGNGSTGGSAPVDANSPYALNSTVTVLGNTDLTKTGYHFLNWNTESDGSGTTYAPGATFSLTQDNGGLVLYAQWGLSSFNLTYSGNSNTGGTAPVDPNSPYVFGTNVTGLGAGNLVRTGFTFSTWNTAANGTGTACAPGATIPMPGADTVLYAQWTANSYTVTYNGNGNTGGTVPVDPKSPYVFNTKVTVLGNTGSLVNTGFSFVGWNTAADGSGTAFAPAATFTLGAANVVLYAQWAVINVSPSSGPVGTLVQITGINLSTTKTVSLGSVAAVPLDASTTGVSALVMPGSASGPFTIVTTTSTYTSTTSFTVTPTGIPANQQGAKLTGSGSTAFSYQGWAVALSADGNTLVEGADQNSSDAGGVWVFTRSAGVWTQQGAKLLGTGATGTASYQGWSVAVSADGNTLVEGGDQDNSNAGAVWVFTRSAGVWTQQGTKLLGTGATGAAYFGSSVALSADGNTMAVGGAGDNSLVGAVWIYTRSGTKWTLQGTKLVGTGSTGPARQGNTVALSADGNTLVEGAWNDNSGIGGVWVFTRSGTTWTQQGTELIGTGGGTSNQGQAVAVSADGNTLAETGPTDNTTVGATWIFTRSGTTWSQQGTKLVGTGSPAPAPQGHSVALTADGNTLLVAGITGSSSSEGVCEFVRSGTNWTQTSNTLIETGAVGNNQNFTVAITPDGNTMALGGYTDNTTVGAIWIFTP